MAVRKPKTQPTPPTPKRQPSASIRRPVTDVDDRISRALERLMPEGMPRYRLAELAGRDASHAARLFQRPPRQTWTIEDLSDYAGALGSTVTAVLMAAGVDAPSESLVERILADPELTASDAGILVGMLQVMRRARQADQVRSERRD